LLDPRTQSIKGERVVLRECLEQSLNLRTGELKLVRDSPEYNVNAVLIALAGYCKFKENEYKPDSLPIVFRETPSQFTNQNLWNN